MNKKRCILTSLLISGMGVAHAWTINTEAEWKASSSKSAGFDFKDGYATPAEAGAVYSSVVKQFDEARKLNSVVFEQSPVWDNWEQIDDITPKKGMGNAYVFLPVAPGDYYILAEYNDLDSIEYPREDMSKDEKKKYYKKVKRAAKDPMTGYHAWHSTDLKNWEHVGKVANSRWVTTAEYVDGKFYIYYDEPNDQDPHLVIDEDLKDGLVGQEMGMVFDDPSDGSDAGILRDEDGTFHMIYEDWSPINASKHSWDSPLAGHVSSPDGITGFEYGEHGPAVDHRTTPTGEFAYFSHSSNKDPGLKYEIHEPEQDAFGDYTLIKVGKHYHLFSDYHPAGKGKSEMRMARFTTDDLNEEFSFSGEIGKGFHPDPSVGFAEGKFYAIMQQETDFVSDGPWVDAVEARAGVDTNGDGTIDKWTDWQRVKETYSQKPGFARIVDVDPAALDTASLSEGFGFQFEFRTTDSSNDQIHPVMDRVELLFEHQK